MHLYRRVKLWWILYTGTIHNTLPMLIDWYTVIHLCMGVYLIAMSGARLPGLLDRPFCTHANVDHTVSTRKGCMRKYALKLTMRSCSADHERWRHKRRYAVFHLPCNAFHYNITVHNNVLLLLQELKVACDMRLPHTHILNIGSNTYTYLNVHLWVAIVATSIVLPILGAQ